MSAAPPTLEFERISDPSAFTAMVDSVAAVGRYALDTEFHRERSYHAQLALVQVAWDGGAALVDPLALSPTHLADLFTRGGTAVMHAADQDLEVFDHVCGTVPTVLFDTQIAAGFLGMSTPSLVALVERFLGYRLGKGDRLTNWLQRPLTVDQETYAIADVAYLLEIADLMVHQLDRRERMQWVLDECERARIRDRSPIDPMEAWRKVKDLRTLKGSAWRAGVGLAAWRERTAAGRDVPVRTVLPDLALLAIAQRRPREADDLRNIRGLDPGRLRRTDVPEVLEAVTKAVADDSIAAPPAGVRLDSSLRPAVSLVSSWLSQHARDLDLDPAVLATRGDIEEYLAAGTGRLSEGWRFEAAGEPIRRLLDGEAAVAFDGGGRLVLEARAGGG